MNERIKELADQANEYALNKASEEDTEEDFDYSFDDDFKSKFAELIVRECATYVKNSNCFTYASQADLCAERIKEHFGVTS